MLKDNMNDVILVSLLLHLKTFLVFLLLNLLFPFTQHDVFADSYLDI